MERLRGEQLRAALALSGWEVRGEVAVAQFVTGNFATGVRFLEEVARIADALNHHPEVTIRFSAVEVTTTTYDVGGLSDRDVALASEIAALAQRMGLTPRRS